LGEAALVSHLRNEGTATPLAGAKGRQCVVQTRDVLSPTDGYAALPRRSHIVGGALGFEDDPGLVAAIPTVLLTSHRTLLFAVLRFL